MDAPSEPIDETARYASGRVHDTGQRLDGEMHRGWSWYRTDGSLMRTSRFDRGRQVGVWRTYGRSKQVTKETEFA